MRRILGQCGQEDFKSIEHLATVLDSPTMLDTKTLTNRQKFAFYFMAEVIKKKIPLELLKVVREVLFWGEGEEVTNIVIKLFRIQKFAKDIEEFKRQWRGQ